MPPVGFPSFDQLLVLVTVAEAGSFSAAARRLHRAQSVVSYAVAQLEAQVGLALFDRSGRVPRLTPAGEALLADARRATGAIDTLRARAAGLQDGLEAELRVGIDVMMPMAALVDALEAFAVTLPDREPAPVHGSAGRSRAAGVGRRLRSRRQYGVAGPSGRYP